MEHPSEISHPANKYHWKSTLETALRRVSTRTRGRLCETPTMHAASIAKVLPRQRRRIFSTQTSKAKCLSAQSQTLRQLNQLTYTPAINQLRTCWAVKAAF